MKKKFTILFTLLFILSFIPAQSNAGVLFDKVSSAVSKVHQKIDAAFNKVKENKAQKAASESETSKNTSVKSKVSGAFSSALSKARSVMQNAFNMNFLSSVPVIFWKKSFNQMFDYAQTSVDQMNIEHNGELITRDDFQDDKALHIKKSAELALHIKSLFGSSHLAYVITLAVGGMKELIDSSFLNPNGGRCWEDFYADMVGASAVFGEKAFDKKLNKYMDSFLKENRSVDTAYENFEEVEKVNYSETTVIVDEASTEDVYNQNEIIENNSENESFSDTTQDKQRLTQEYYEAVKSGDTEKIKIISEQLRNLK